MVEGQYPLYFHLYQFVDTQISIKEYILLSIFKGQHHIIIWLHKDGSVWVARALIFNPKCLNPAQ